MGYSEVMAALRAASSSSSSDFDPVDPVSNPHAWISLFAFFICIPFVIIAPKVPLIPRCLLPLDRMKRILGPDRGENPSKELLDDSAEEENQDQPQERKPRNPFSRLKHQYRALQERLSKKWIMLPLDMATVPIILLILLFCTTTLTAEILKVGILGDDRIKPYGIIILFMALAYDCISLDLTGIFVFISYAIIAQSRGYALTLWILFGVFSAIVTILTNNDIVVLALTPICCHMVLRAPEMDIIPFIVAQMFLANVWAVTLQIGNPTNLIVAEAYDINFFEYSAWMTLPALTAGFTCFGLLYLVFRKRIPRRVNIGPRMKIEAGRVVSVRDLHASDIIPRPQQQPSSAGDGDDSSSDTDENGHASGNGQQRRPGLRGYLASKIHITRAEWIELLELIDTKTGAILKTMGVLACLALIGISSLVGWRAWPVTLFSAGVFLFYDLTRDLLLYVLFVRRELRHPQHLNHLSTRDWLRKFAEKSVTFKALVRLPWKIVPFVIGMFTIAELLNHYGWVSLLAEAFSAVVGSARDVPFLAELVSVFVMAYTSALAANVLNNQPMTILFSKMIYNSQFDVGPEQERGAVYALILGATVGGDLTYIASLACILWLSVLRANGVKSDRMNYLVFAKYGFIVIPPVIAAASFVIVLEVFIYRYI